MALLERISSMKQQGLSDQQIANSLKEQGVAMKDISEALSQLKIKSAIYPDAPATEEMLPSIMPSQEQQTATVPEQVPQPQQQMQQIQQVQDQTQQYYPQDQTQQYYPQDQTQQYYPQDQTQQYYPQNYTQDQYAQYYPQDQGYYQQTLDVETVREIAKQEAEQTFKQSKDEINSLSKIKTDLKFEVENMSNRLAKIEAVIQELQSAIIRKMGEYGESIAGISDEIKATQDSFSKVINPLLDKRRNVSAEKTEEQTKRQKGKKQQATTPRGKEPAASFEDYFR